MSELNQDHTLWLLGEIRDKTRGGKPLEKVIQQMENPPFGQAPPAREFEEAIRLFKEETGQIVQYENVESLTNREFESGNWYSGPNMDEDHYWPSLKPILEEKLGSAVEEIDAASSKVLASLRPAGQEEFDTRGLVLGYVQSGKTTNFLSVIAKAVDVGYRFVIVLAGLTDNLRYQTQLRLEEQLLNQTRNWNRLTTLEHDFLGNQEKNASSLLAPGNTLINIAVVKKNARVLAKLNRFIRAAQTNADECPILVIDDEADQASIDVSPAQKQETSAINNQIRALLRNKKTAYVAYTATPFANILVDPNDDQDIYPRDFIHVLPRPNGYFGVETIFGRERLFGESGDADDGLNMIRSVPDEEQDLLRPPSKRADAESWTGEIPDSLMDAVKWFVLASAARRRRGQENAHSSMLIHTAMLTIAHEETRDLLEAELTRFRTEFNRGDLDEELRNLWEKEQEAVPPSTFNYETLSYEELKPYIARVLEDIDVVMDNGYSDKRLVYSEDKAETVIAIGGNTLARGLTLEGLICSYFVRNATAFDTLSQMGRWFGFRKGYEDLPRIWMTEELESWYRSLALLEADLRQDLSRYEREGIDPMEFQARLRVHRSMPVTSRAKQQSAVVSNPSYSGARIQTILFRHKDEDWLNNNLRAAQNLIDTLNDGKHRIVYRKENGTFVLYGATTDQILDFLDSYRIYEDSELGEDDARKLTSYIRREREKSSIRTWNVSIYGKSGSDGKTIDLGLNQEINLITRSQLGTSKPGVANIKALVGSMDRINDADLSREQVTGLTEKIKQSSSKRDAMIIEERANILGPDVGHLALYYIDPESQPANKMSPEDYLRSGKNMANRRKDLEAVAPVVGMGIFFPPTNDPEPAPEYISAPAPDPETLERIRGQEEEIHSVNNKDENERDEEE